MRLLTLGLLALSVAGCTTYKLWTETDADEHKGTLQLSYEYRRFESPQVDERAAAGMAKERCATWKYTTALRDGEMKTCIDGEAAACKKWQVTRQYRCSMDQLNIKQPVG